MNDEQKRRKMYDIVSKLYDDSRKDDIRFEFKIRKAADQLNRLIFPDRGNK